MKHTRMILSLLGISLALSQPARAGLFGDKKVKAKGPTGPKVRYEYHLHIPDKITEQEFVDLFGHKKALNEDLIVLHRLNAEKQDHYTDLQKMLLNEFSVLPENRYQYDRDTHTIYELVSEPRVMNVNDAPGEDPAGAAQVEKGPYGHRIAQVLEDTAQGRKFLEMLRQKKLVHNELTVLRALVIQKKIALKRVNDQLLAKFSLSPDGVYHYDADEMALYELVPPGKR